MSGSLNGDDNPETKFREAFRAHIERRGKISEETSKQMRRNGRGNYRGLDDWSPEDKKWLESDRARLGELAEKAQLTPNKRKEIEDGVRRESE